MKEYKELQKSELVRHLESNPDVLFYHLVRMDLSAGDGGARFVREDASYFDKCDTYNTWAEGLFHLGEHQRSFVAPVYNEFGIKHSLHVYVELDSSVQASARVNSKSRDIYLNATLPRLDNDIPVTLNQAPNPMGTLDEFVTSIETDSAFRSLTIPAPLENQLSQTIKGVLDTLSVSDPAIENHLRRITDRLFRFLYPTAQTPKKQYSIFIVPGYVSEGKELTSGGVVVLFEPKGFNGDFDERITRIKTLTALWSNLETVESLVQLSEDRSRRAAMAQLMARNLSHNIGSHVLSRIKKLTSAEQAMNLLKFVQDRMEFIANGLEPIFHSNYWLAQEIINEYLEEDRKKLLLVFNNISGNEQINSTRIRFSKDSEDILVSVPTGSLGFHALYTLLENIIRNSVKHNRTLPDHLSYHLSISEPSDYPDHYEIAITDNLGDMNRGGAVDFDAINSRIRLPLLANGRLRPSAWGLLEMKICAAFLAGFPLDLIDLAHKGSDAIKVTVDGIERRFPPPLVAFPDSSTNLVYTFYLQRPKLAALCTTSISEDPARGVNTVDCTERFRQFGSAHRFAVFDSEEHAVNHEAETNQRSIFLNSEMASPEPNSDIYDYLWGAYAARHDWASQNVDFIYGDKDTVLQMDGEKKYVVFDDHEEWWNAGGKDVVINQPQNLLFYESVSSHSPTKKAICERLETPLASRAFQLQVRETVNSTVLLLDERLQKLFFDDKRLGRENSKNPIFANVFIPPAENSLDLNSVETGQLVTWATEIFEKRNVKVLDYMLIHRSLLAERKIQLTELSNRLKPKFTVFVSGGGTPPTIKSGDFYLPLEVLNHCFGLPHPSKFALVDVLKSLRKISI